MFQYRLVLRHQGKVLSRQATSQQLLLLRTCAPYQTRQPLTYWMKHSSDDLTSEPILAPHVQGVVWMDYDQSRLTVMGTVAEPRYVGLAAFLNPTWNEVIQAHAASIAEAFQQGFISMGGWSDDDIRFPSLNHLHHQALPVNTLEGCLEIFSKEVMEHFTLVKDENGVWTSKKSKVLSVLQFQPPGWQMEMWEKPSVESPAQQGVFQMHFQTLMERGWNLGPDLETWILGLECAFSPILFSPQDIEKHIQPMRDWVHAVWTKRQLSEHLPRVPISIEGRRL